MRKFGTIYNYYIQIPAGRCAGDTQFSSCSKHFQEQEFPTVMSPQPLSLAAKNTRTSGKKYVAAKSIPSPPCSMTDQKSPKSQPELDKYPPLLVNWGFVHPYNHGFSQKISIALMIPLCAIVHHPIGPTSQPQGSRYTPYLGGKTRNLPPSKNVVNLLQSPKINHRESCLYIYYYYYYNYYYCYYYNYYYLLNKKKKKNQPCKGHDYFETQFINPKTNGGFLE